jgi:hypothetical protein
LSLSSSKAERRESEKKLVEVCRSRRTTRETRDGRAETCWVSTSGRTKKTEQAPRKQSPGSEAPGLL